MKSGPQRLSGCSEPPDTERVRSQWPNQKKVYTLQQLAGIKRDEVKDDGVRDVTRSTNCVLFGFFWWRCMTSY